MKWPRTAPRFPAQARFVSSPRGGAGGGMGAAGEGGLLTDLRGGGLNLGGGERAPGRKRSAFIDLPLLEGEARAPLPAPRRGQPAPPRSLPRPERLPAPPRTTPASRLPLPSLAPTESLGFSKT